MLDTELRVGLEDGTPIVGFDELINTGFFKVNIYGGFVFPKVTTSV
jgi:hypothetical protein